MDLTNMSIDMIPALSTAMTASAIRDNIGVAVFSKTLDMAEQSGAALIEMMRHSMELSVNPNVGANIDISI